MLSAALPFRALSAAATRHIVFFAFLFAVRNLPAAAGLPLPSQQTLLPHTRGSPHSIPFDDSKLAAAPAPSLAWRHKCDSAIEADGAFASDGTFYVGSLGGTLYAIEPHMGKRLWQFKAGGAIFAAPVVAADGRCWPALAVAV
jgi:outer membrane protein assembly factor BamB